jgi:VWFA-related protein
VEGVLVELDGQKGLRLALACLTAAALAAQETPTFRADTSLALVRFYLAKGGHYILDLKKDDVVLLEDGQPRPFTVFEGGGSRRRSVPVDLALVFDVSGSVVDQGLLDPVAFKNGLLDGIPNARLAVYSFTNKLHRFCPPTRDFETLRGALAALGERKPLGVTVPMELPAKRKANGNGASWIYESVIGAARDLSIQPGNATRLVVVFSDGLPSTTSAPEDAAKICEDLGISVYPILLGHWELGKRIKAVQEKERPGREPSALAGRLNGMEQEIQEFASLGRLTGGGAFDPPAMGSGVLKQIVSGLAARVDSEYVIGFAPDTDGAPKRHKLEVRVRDKSLGQIMGGKRVVSH